MSEEIKEILNILNQMAKENKESDNSLQSTVILFDILYKVLDYITNLQQKVEQLENKSLILEENNKLLIQQKAQMYEDLDNMSDRLEQLEKENDDLKNRLENEVAENTLRLKEVEQLENIRKESIEFIKNNTYYDYMKGHVNSDNLLNILNKGSE